MRATIAVVLECCNNLNLHLRHLKAPWRAELPYDSCTGWSFAIRGLNESGYKILVDGLTNREIVYYMNGVFAGLRLPRDADEG